MKTLNQIKTHVEQFFNVEDIAIRSRKQPLPDYRKYYCKMAKDLTEHSYETIGDVINRFGSTANVATKEANSIIKTNSIFRDEYDRCIRDFRKDHYKKESIKLKLFESLDTTFAKLRELNQPRKQNYIRITL